MTNDNARLPHINLSFEVIFREVTRNLPLRAKYKGGRWHYAELHVAEFGLYGPAALGVICVKRYPQMVSLTVVDDVRRYGLGTELIKASLARWPNLTWQDTIESKPSRETCTGRNC